MSFGFNDLMDYKRECIKRELEDIKSKNRKYIKHWSELKEVESPTHILEIDLKYGSGWIKPKKEPENPQSWDGYHYLSTHTFYGSSYKDSTEILQSCGFNVELANWDELGY